MASDPDEGQAAVAEKEEKPEESGSGSSSSSSGSKNLDKEAARAKKEQEAVTDYHFEKESRNIAAATEAFNSLPPLEPKKASAFTGKIADEDLAAVMEECDLIKEDAEALLKRADGSLQKAIELYIS